MKKVVLFLFVILCYNCLLAQFKIQRLYRTKDCIQGYLLLNGDKIGYTLELPWNENAKDVSAIPEGTYNGKIREDGDLGWRIELTDVPGRANAEIHIGNYPWNSKGCTLLGTGINLDNCTVQNSSAAIEKLRTNYSFQKIINQEITFEFTTIPACTNCNSLTDSRDGQTYKIVKIGSQVWMAQNLNYSTGNSWCNDCGTYGRLYDWETAKRACPSGWHLPSDNEWQTLINYEGGNEVAGGKLKSTSGWNSPNTGATNESGFSALPGGYRGYNGAFYDIGNGGFWWSASEGSGTDAWFCDVGYYGANAGRYDGSKAGGVSVRCVRDL